MFKLKSRMNKPYFWTRDWTQTLSMVFWDGVEYFRVLFGLTLWLQKSNSHVGLTHGSTPMWTLYVTIICSQKHYVVSNHSTPYNCIHYFLLLYWDWQDLMGKWCHINATSFFHPWDSDATPFMVFSVTYYSELLNTITMSLTTDKSQFDYLDIIKYWHLFLTW